VSNTLIVPLFICLNEQDQAHAITSFDYFLIVVNHWGFIGVATMYVGVTM